MQKMRIVEVMAAGLLVVQVALSVLIFARGGIIPVHWNFVGEVDRQGHVTEIVVLLLLSVGTYAMMRFLQKHPQYYNFPYALTDDRLGREKMGDMMAWVNLLTMALFTAIDIAVYAHSNIPIYALPLIVISMIWIIVRYWRKIRKLKA